MNLSRALESWSPPDNTSSSSTIDLTTSDDLPFLLSLEETEETGSGSEQGFGSLEDREDSSEDTSSSSSPSRGLRERVIFVSDPQQLVNLLGENVATVRDGKEEEGDYSEKAASEDYGTYSDSGNRLKEEECKLS